MCASPITAVRTGLEGNYKYLTELDFYAYQRLMSRGVFADQ
jgi:hypothetical protein